MSSFDARNHMADFIVLIHLATEEQSELAEFKYLELLDNNLKKKNRTKNLPFDL